jgi:hypothetical protein
MKVHKGTSFFFQIMTGIGLTGTYFPIKRVASNKHHAFMIHIRSQKFMLHTHMRITPLLNNLFLCLLHIPGSPGSVVTRLWAERPEFHTCQERDFFLFVTASRPGLGPTNPLIELISGAAVPPLKRPGREANHSPSSNAEIKNVLSYTSTPPYVFMVWCSIK